MTEASTTLDIPQGSTAVLAVTFSSESSCYGTGAGGANWCSVRVMVDETNQALPPLGLDYAFDSSDDNAELFESSFESHALQRTMNVGPGSHTVTVEAAVAATGLDFFLNGWTLNVVAYKQ